MSAHSGGTLPILAESGTRFTQLRGQQAAASLAYYALFSLFPLTLLLAWLLDFLFRGELAYERAVTIIRMVFPFSGELIDQELHEVFDQQRGTIGVIGGIGLLWAASGFFITLANNINLAWPSVKLRNYVHGRLVAFAMVGTVILLMMVSLLTTTLLSLVPSMLYFFGDSEVIANSPLWLLILRIVAITFTFFTFVGMYRWVPNKDVHWKAVLIGALAATIAWELTRSAFTLYLSSGLARFQFVYGSLSALIALMIWIYLGNLITLFSAYLVATMDLRIDRVEMADAKPQKPEVPLEKPVTKEEHEEEPSLDKHIHG